MKHVLLCLVAMLWATSALAQNNLLADVQRIRADYPPTMSDPQKAELLNRVAWEHRAEGWGLLKKTGGSRCPAPQGVDIACDILVYAPTAWHFDVLADGQIPAWQDDGPCVSPPSGCDMARFLAPVGPPPAAVSMGDIPVPRDYDGDGQLDVAVYRMATGQWFVARSSAGPLTVNWGAPALGDIPVPADYDGDRKADIAVYRAATGEWFILNSSNGTTTHLTFGSASGLGLRDTPLAGDYDRDGRADLGIYRASTGEWFVRRSSDGAVVHVQFGAP